MEKQAIRILRRLLLVFFCFHLGALQAAESGAGDHSLSGEQWFWQDSLWQADDGDGRAYEPATASSGYSAGGYNAGFARSPGDLITSVINYSAQALVIDIAEDRNQFMVGLNLFKQQSLQGGIGVTWNGDGSAYDASGKDDYLSLILRYSF